MREYNTDRTSALRLRQGPKRLHAMSAASGALVCVPLVVLQWLLTPSVPPALPLPLPLSSPPPSPSPSPEWEWGVGWSVAAVCAVVSAVAVGGFYVSVVAQRLEDARAAAQLQLLATVVCGVLLDAYWSAAAQCTWTNFLATAALFYGCPFVLTSHPLMPDVISCLLFFCVFVFFFFPSQFTSF